MVAQPSGIVTFLFTDIERSTALLRALGTERYADALADHRRLLRAAFERHDGYEVDHEGDSFFVTFSDAAEAIAAAIEAQSALDSHAWADGQTIRVRMGAHTGEALVAPPKYVGLDVHRAARIMSAAHGGQLLISERTRQLVYDAQELTTYCPTHSSSQGESEHQHHQDRGHSTQATFLQPTHNWGE